MFYSMMMKPRNKKEYTNTDEDTPPTEDFDWGDQPFNDDYSYGDNAGIEGDEEYLPDWMKLKTMTTRRRTKGNSWPILNSART